VRGALLIRGARAAPAGLIGASAWAPGRAEWAYLRRYGLADIEMRKPQFAILRPKEEMTQPQRVKALLIRTERRLVMINPQTGHTIHPREQHADVYQKDGVGRWIRHGGLPRSITDAECGPSDEFKRHCSRRRTFRGYGQQRSDRNCSSDPEELEYRSRERMLGYSSASHSWRHSLSIVIGGVAPKARYADRSASTYRGCAIPIRSKSCCRPMVRPDGGRVSLVLFG
jgi:hypothetical protein